MTRHLAIVGPTAAGKSALALDLARGGAEIVSLDSMQVYRGMDVGTAKPAVAERASVPHHLIDVADPSEEWSVARTRVLARAAIADIEARGRRAILVGGTGLYVRAVVDDLDLPGTDKQVRARLEAVAADPDGLAASYARLRALDPGAAERIEPGNRRRVVRALEVIEISGRPFSSFGPGLGTYAEPALDVTMVGIAVDPGELDVRIAARVAAMRASGFLAEVERLVDGGRPLSRTAEQAIGYHELLAVVRREEPSLDAALARTVVRTRQFARRQVRWFRRDPRITWIEPAANSGASAAVVLASWEAPVAAGRGR